MATNLYQKNLYENLRKTFIAYERNSKCKKDENIDQIIVFSRKYGCKQLIRYAAMTEEDFSSMPRTKDAKEIKDRLTQFIRDYYETSLLLSVIYGSIKIMNDPTSPKNFGSTVSEDIDECMSFYLEYDGIQDPDVLTIIESVRKNGILQTLNALRFNYTSSGYMELKELFYKVDDKYLPILDIVNALNPFLQSCPIAEIA